MRLVCAAPGLRPLVQELGLGGDIVDTAPEVVLTNDPAAVSATDLKPVHPDLPVVMSGSGIWEGKPVRAVVCALTHPEDAVEMIEPVATALGVAERGAALQKVRSARLLALRMHVARYVVRTGAPQRTVAALVDPWTYRHRQDLLLALLDAAGGLAPQVVLHDDGAASAMTAALPVADVLLFGRRGTAPVDLARQLDGRVTRSAGGNRVWCFSVDRLVAEPGYFLVEAVEALLRVITPEALGANGTPPSADLAVPVQ